MAILKEKTKLLPLNRYDQLFPKGCKWNILSNTSGTRVDTGGHNRMPAIDKPSRVIIWVAIKNLPGVNNGQLRLRMPLSVAHTNSLYQFTAFEALWGRSKVFTIFSIFWYFNNCDQPKIQIHLFSVLKGLALAQTQNPSPNPWAKAFH